MSMNREFLVACGFKLKESDYAESKHELAWEYPDGEWDLESTLVIDLNFLFKYAVPKYLESGKYWFIRLEAYNWGYVVVTALSTPRYGGSTESFELAEDKDPAQALYKALKEVL